MAYENLGFAKSRRRPNLIRSKATYREGAFRECGRRVAFQRPPDRARPEDHSENMLFSSSGEKERPIVHGQGFLRSAWFTTSAASAYTERP